MLPSCGHFKNIPCPFFKFALCVRPHCPYKHQNEENAQQRQLFPPLVDETETVIDSKNELNTSAHKSYDTNKERLGNATYIPTPMELSSKPPGILKSSSSVETPAISYVPEYKPTPIAKLKEFTTVPVKASKSVYTPEFTVAIRKKKNVEEYDPTEVKCIPKKSVTFSDEPDPSVQVIEISSDDDLDDNENAPKFSDDDFEEESESVTNSMKQVPDVITIKEESIEEEKIDEFSVVDQILVDCKKNERLLNSFKKTHPKTNDIASKIKNRDKNTTVESEKIEIKKNKNNSINSDKVVKSISDVKVDNNSISSIKTEKNESNDELDDDSKFKSLKDEVLGLINGSPTKNRKKDDKNIKKEKAVIKEKKNSSSHSTHHKEKLKKVLKETDQHLRTKKHSHPEKADSSDGKCKKFGKHSFSVSSVEKDSKKGIANPTTKNNDRSNSPSKKKQLHKNGNTTKTAQPHVVKLKDKKHSNDHSAKRKSSDSDSERHTSKSKSLHSEKKVHSHSLPRKRSKFSESQASGKSNLLNNGDKMGNNSNVDSDMDETGLNELLSSSESDLDEECRRIFEECYPENSESTNQDRNEETLQHRSSDASDLLILRKKRLAHPGAAEFKPPSKQPKVEVKRTLNPAQVMLNRFHQSQARFAQLNEKKELSKGTEKKRLSFLPSKNLLEAVKSKSQSNPALENFSPLPPTVSQTYKINKRTAHIPEVAKKPRPIIPSEHGSKVPANIRQKFLNSFIDECLKFCPSEDEAYDMALEEEKKAYGRSSSKPLYLNVAANALQRLRKQAEKGPDSAGNSSLSSKTNAGQNTVSHAAVLNGPLAQRRSFSIGKKKEAPEIKGKAELYQYLLEYVLTPDQLKENSYPLPHPTEKDRAVIEGAFATRTLYCNDAFKRMCSRCRKTYYVNVDGDYVREEECDFHWGRLWKKRIAGNFESRYSCCQGDAESDGCCVSPGHVFEGSESHVLRGYAKTLPKTPPPDKCYGIYALDCEMCYTTAGMELTRITVVDSDLNTVYESFVKPMNKVLDYNTRFSGITEDDLKNVRTSLIDVQAVLLCIFSDKTILIGHSLESDFKALKLFHNTVIDTSVVFPHKSGLPFKRALRTLMAEHLNKIIQNDVGGHDSREDAVACMELMLWKVKEDIRSNR